MTLTLRKSARATGVLLVGALAGSAFLAAGAADAAADELAPQSLITESSPADVESRIVGGEPADEGEYPFVAYLSIESDGATFACGGSLYAPDMILTAAHCVDGTGPTTGITAHFGSVDLGSDDIVTYQSEHVYSGNISGIPTDWALVKLQTEVEGIDPLPVVSSTEYDEGDFTIIGWGDTEEGAGQGSEVLQEAVVPFVGDDDCVAAYGDTVTPDEEICAGVLDEGGVDSCQGDSGGPMFREDSAGEYVQVGIVSHGQGCAQPGFPGVYTQLSTFAAGIAAVAEGENTPAEVADIAVSTTIDTPVEITLTADDADGDDLRFKVGEPESGQLTSDDDTLTTLTFTPEAGFEGEVVFPFAANDGITDSPQAAVTVMVEGEAVPTPTPTDEPTEEPTAEPSPTDEPSDEPSDEPTGTPTEEPTQGPDDEELPDTGMDAGTGLTLALLLAAGGTALAVAGHRRTAGV